MIVRFHHANNIVRCKFGVIKFRLYPAKQLYENLNLVFITKKGGCISNLVVEGSCDDDASIKRNRFDLRCDDSVRNYLSQIPILSSRHDQ